MPYPEHSTHTHTFEGGMNSDAADEALPKNVARVFLNCRVLSSTGGNLGVVSNVMGNTLVTTPLPAGTNKTISAKADERNNKVYFLVWNSNLNHVWFQYDDLLKTIIPIITNLTDTDGVDIMGLNPIYPVLHVDIVLGTDQNTGNKNTILYYCDALNKGRKLNIQKCLDKTTTGYGYTIVEDYITQYKKAPAFAPVVANSTQSGVSGYWTDLTRNSNFLYAQLFKFCYRYIFSDGEISPYSDWSMVALPPNQSYLGAGAITTDSNCIAVLINTGSPDVVKIEIAMLTTGPVTTNGVTAQGATLPWKTVVVLNKSEQFLTSDTLFSYNFYNDGAYILADQDKVNSPQSFMFRVPHCQSFTGLAMTQTGGYEGFPRVPIDITVTNNPIPLYIPPGTVNQFNSPSLSVAQTSYATENAGLFEVARYNPTIRFIVGADVKKGNVFTISGQNGNLYGPADFLHIRPLKGHDHYFFSYTATLADTSISVANRIKSYLRGIGRGIPDAHNGISGESVDISGNVTFFYTYKGQWLQAITTFTGTATPVQVGTLQNNGISIQVIKSGSIRQYAIGYEDDDERKSNAYTNDKCVIRTPFLTEAPGGVLQQPVHTVSLLHRPPIWARRWILYRTPDESQYVQMLIQQVIPVTVITGADMGEYLDLVVGSLFTYQQIHKDVIIAYQFSRGDRLRLITDTNTGDYYTPFFETGILSYQEVTTELRNAQIKTFGTDIVLPSDGPIASYVGKNILIAGYERTIIGLATTTTANDSYQLDQILNIGPTLTTALEPNYTFVDRRGIIRISKPPAAYSVVDFSTVEVYTPVVTTDNLDFKNFNDTAQKFDISNFGTDTRAHRGTHQDQDGTDDSTLVSTPAIVLVTEGDAYIRDREMPTNTALVDTQVIVEPIEDPNFSDFYPSTLNNLGRVYPKDTGSGQNFFGSRTRFSNNFVADTAINGLNDYNNLDRVDYEDANGDVMLTKVKENKLYIFKQLKDGWILIGQTIITTATGQQFVGTSDKFLGQIQYYEFGDGIGNNPESWGESDQYMYHAAPNSGIFVQMTGAGIEPISKIYGYDFQSRAILAQVKKYGLKIPFGFDKSNDNMWWSMPSYIAPIFNNPLTQPDWNVFGTAVPGGATPVIVTQPANGVVTYDMASGNFLINMTADFVGTDSFTYKFALSGGGFSAVVNGCITVQAPVLNASGFQIRASTAYCRTIGGSNTGYQDWKVLEGYYLADGSLTGFIMPNIYLISPDAVVPDGTTITYNDTSNPAPSGGANGDVWYNEPADALYKKLAGVWTQLFNRVINNFYKTAIQNTGACVVPPPANNFVLSSSFNTPFTSLVCTNAPAFSFPTAINANTGLNFVTNIPAQTIQVGLGSGAPITRRLDLAIDGVVVSSVTGIVSMGVYNLNMPATTISHNISIQVNI